MPKLTVVVPTRERADTLHHTLKTLVQQDYEDFQILVSDNASVDDTRKVALSFNDKRIAYINTGKRVDMSQNWEFALTHATGEFITFIGDDDGFLPGAITKAMTLLEQTHVPAMIWHKAEYCWLDYPVAAMQNLIITDVRAGQATYVKAAAQLKRVIAFDAAYTTLPCLYNGIVRRSIMEKVKAMSTGGLFFNSISPDVYSGIALSLFVDEYLHVGYPFSVNGASRHSNGTSFTRTNGTNPQSPAAKFRQENSRQYDARIQLGPAVLICVMGEYMLVKDSLKQLDLPEPDWGNYVKKLAASAAQSFLQKEVALSAEFTARAVGLTLPAPQPQQTKTTSVVTPVNLESTLSFIAPPELVKNVHDACALVGALAPHTIQVVRYSVVTLAHTFTRTIFKHMYLEARKFCRALLRGVT